MDSKLSQAGNGAMCPVGVFAKGRKILVGLRHYGSDKCKTASVWTCPGGRCEDDETIETALRREVKEETGITKFEIQHLIGEVPGAREGDVVPLFLCETNQEPRLLEPHKFKEWRWVDCFREFPDNFINNNAKTIITSFFYGKDTNTSHS